MATEKQIAANRANAKRSTGPKTAAGKQKSSQNAYKHGLSRLQPLNSSSITLFRTIVGALADELRTENQLTAVNDLAQAQAELARIQAIRAERWAEINPDAWLDDNTKDLKRLAALDRYERYAFTRRRRASKRLGLS